MNLVKKFVRDNVDEGDSHKKKSSLEYPGLIILGNSGADKSFLANIVLGKESFVHKASAIAA